MNARLFGWIAAGVMVAAAHAAEEALPLVPEGFKIELFAREPLVRNPCAMAFDARGRLFVGQGPQYRNPKPDTPRDTIEILLDTDGDGVADKAKTFARNLNNIQGLAWRGRDLWVANAPDLTIVRDLDGDDEADEYVLVYTDLGNREHGLHGLNWAPDGKLYMSKGNSKGLNQPGRVAPKPFRDLFGLPTPPGASDLPPPRTFRAADYRPMYHDPADDWGREGGILRCDDLGANLEIVSRGFRNPWDIGFDAEFNWLGTDNDQSEGDRIFMPFPGAHFGWSHRWSVSWTGAEHLPTVPISGPVFSGSGTGIVYAQAPDWPRAYRGAWFINDYLHRTTYVYRPAWDGALLQPRGGRWEPFIRAGSALFNPVDIENGPDGALYLTGWGARLDAQWKDGKQVNEGRVFRVMPRGVAGANWNLPKRARPPAEWTVAELIEDLGTEIPVWRTNAADELVRRGNPVRTELIARLEAGKLPTAQETWLLWTLGRIEPDSPAGDAWFATKGRTLSANAALQSLRIVAHRLRETRRPADVPNFIAEGLRAAEPRVRFAAAQAVMQAGAGALVGELWAAAERETDRLTYYAIWRALEALAPAAELQAKLTDPQAGVRRAALLALLEQGALTEQAVQAMVKDADPGTAGLAALWLAKRAGNPLLVIEPFVEEFSGELKVAITPGLKPSRISYTIDGSEPDPRTGRGTARFTITETTTVKAALFIDGRKVGNTAEKTYRKRSDTGHTFALTPPATPTTVEQVLPLLSNADRARGRAVFAAAGCATCHRVEQTGGAFGPELSGLGARGNAAHVVRAILEPNAEITEGFALLHVTTRDGASTGGRLHEETTDLLTLVLPDGSVSKIRQAEVARRESSHVSPMPAFDRVLTAQDVADVTAWLSGDKTSEPTAAPSGFMAEVSPDRVTLTDGGKPVATLVLSDAQTRRPAFQNLHAPGGVPITRRHPPAAPEAIDHATMHPGFWLGLGDVNGEDFWRNKASIVHERFVVPLLATQNEVTFETANRMIARAGDTLGQLHTRIRLTRLPNAYCLAWEASIAATERDLVFGDQEEMGFGVRMTAALSEKSGQGRVTLSDGSIGAKTAWGRVGDWAVYSARHDGRDVGAALLAAPATAQRQPWWHTRDYGLMVANFFGRKALPESADGKLTLKRGDTLTLRVALLLFDAPEGETPDFAAVWRAFPKESQAAPVQGSRGR